MIEGLAEAALRTLLLAIVVQLGLWLFRIRLPQLRLTAWTVILLASLAMPALQWATPFRLPMLPELSSAGLMASADPQLQFLSAEVSGPGLSAGSDERPALIHVLGAVYLLVGGALLLRLAVGVALSLRLLIRATPVRLDWAAEDDVRISHHVAGPVTVAHVILLPTDAAHWPAAMRQAVLAHERAHVARWDFAMLLVSQVNRAVFWFSPLSWWLHRRLASLAELASDDHAMEVTGDRAGYAEVLLEMGRRSGQVFQGVAMARPATLRYRIERILSGRFRPSPVSPIQRVALAIGAAGLSIAAASSAPSSAPPSDVTTMLEQQKQPISSNAAGSFAVQAAEDGPEAMPTPQPPLSTVPSAPRHGPLVPPGLSAVPSRPRPTARAWQHPLPYTSVKNTRATSQIPMTRQAGDGHSQQAAASASSRASSPNSGDSVPQTAMQLDTTRSAGIAAGERRQALSSHSRDSSTDNELPLLKLTDRTCTGVYLPVHAGGFVDGGLDTIRAKFFRDASGAPWLTLFQGGQKPVIRSVTVTEGGDDLSSGRNTVFTMLPGSTRHLRSFIQRPYGTIDFACGGTSTHLFDG